MLNLWTRRFGELECLRPAALLNLDTKPAVDHRYLIREISKERRYRSIQLSWNIGWYGISASQISRYYQKDKGIFI